MFATFDSGGFITALFATFQPSIPGCEEVADNDPRVVFFLAHGSAAVVANAGWRDLIRRRARILQNQGDELAALLLLKTIGE